MTQSVASRTIEHGAVVGASLQRRGGSRANVARAWRIVRKIPLVPLAIIGVFVVFAVFAPLLAPYDPTRIALPQKLIPPLLFEGGNPAYLLGTDSLGRDVLSRLIWGARVSLSVSAAVVLLSSAVGLVIGVAAGYIGGRTDSFLMRFTDSSLAFPGILIALLFAISLGPGVWTVILALSVLITLQIGLVVLAEATLGFLGAGVPPPTPSWGSLVSDGRNFVDTAWWIAFFPGLSIGLLVLCVNYLGDWLRDTLDPRLRRTRKPGEVTSL